MNKEYIKYTGRLPVSWFQTGFEPLNNSIISLLVYSDRWRMCALQVWSLCNRSSQSALPTLGNFLKLEDETKIPLLARSSVIVIVSNTHLEVGNADLKRGVMYFSDLTFQLAIGGRLLQR